MKSITIFLAVTSLTLLTSGFAQEETPSAAPSESPATSLETPEPSTPVESTLPSAAPTSSPLSAESPSPSPKTELPKKSPAATSSASPATTSSGKKMSVEATIKDMENKWVAAFLTHDVKVVEPLVARDYIGVNSKGKVQNRGGVLGDVKDKKETYTVEKNEKLDVRRYGNNVAVAVGTEREEGTGKNGKKFKRIYRYTDTWVERGGTWQCVAAHVSLVSEK